MKKQSKKALSLLLSLLMLLTVMLPSAVAADNGTGAPETSLSQEAGTNSTEVFEPCLLYTSRNDKPARRHAVGAFAAVCNSIGVHREKAGF